jgi:hypothetical protein
MIVKHVLQPKHEASNLEFFELDDHTCGIKREERTLAIFNAHTVTIAEILKEANKHLIINPIGYVG